jgi:hypothetical protein
MRFSDSRLPNPSAVMLAAAMLVAPALFGGAPPQQSEDVTVQMLQKELAKRDAVIIDLLKRVKALEAERNGASKGAETGTGAAPAKQHDAVAAANSPASAPASAPAGQTAGGGGLKIDQLAAERALERSLVQEGARLLRPGEIEFYPGVTFSRYESDFPTTVQSGSDTYIGQARNTLNVYDPRADIRMGLPFNTQLEIGLPSRVVNAGLGTSVDGAVQSATDRYGLGFGDAQIGLAALLAREKSWRPNVVGRLVWLTGSGAAVDNGVSLGGGNPGLATQLSAYWRRDPAVFLMSGGYAHYFEGSGIRPGDNIYFSQGVALAVSPETAMIFSLDQSYMKAFKSNGAELPGTDRLSSVFSFSTSTILGRGLFLRLSAGIGLTRDSPRYQFGVSIPFRFRLR